MNIRFFGRLTLALTAAVLAQAAAAAPGDTIYFEDFQDGDAGGWSQVGGTGTFGVGEFPAGSDELSLFTCCGGGVDVHSPSIDTAFPGALLSFRIQRGGANIGSDVPEGPREYLDVYFLRDDGAWIFQGRHPPDGGAPGETFNEVFTLAAEFRHANFRIRLFQDSGNAGEDYWHVHEINIVEASPSGGLGALCDDFSRGLGSWTVNNFGGNGQATPTTQAANSPLHGLAIFDGQVRAQSLPLDLSATTTATLNLWVRRGANAFSDAPNGAQDLAVGFLDAGGNLVGLQTLPGAGTPGETFNLSFNLPAAALHDAFRLRLERYGNGAGGYWHVDDVCVDVARTPDHFAIRHDGGGVNCQAEPVEIVMHDTNHFVVENFTGAVNLSTSTGNGDWSAVDANGTLTNAGGGNGSYTFVAADGGNAILGFADTFIETVNIDTNGGGFAEDVTEDGDIAFAATGFNFLVNGNTIPVPNQIAGKPSDAAPDAALIELQAIRTSDETGACAAAFAGNVGVELAFTCEDPASCHGVNLDVSGNAVAANAAGPPAAFSVVSLDFGGTADSTADLVLRYGDAGRIRLHARHVLNPSGAIMNGASSTFTVRPFGFHVVAVGNPAATDVDGGVYRKAGEDFDVTVTAVGWQDSDDVNGDGVPDGHGDSDAGNNADLSDNPTLPGFGTEAAPDGVALSANLWQPGGGDDPGLSGSPAVAGFVNGSAGTIVNYAEAGIIEIAASLADGDYLGAGDMQSRSGPVGRFTPDHFDVGITQHGCSDANGFGYSGQPIRALTVTARNAGGGGVQNFAASPGFAKDVFLNEVSGASGSVQNGGIAALDFAAGSVTVAAAPSGVAFSFTSKETAPATITLRATDADGVSSQNHAEAITQIRAARFVVEDVTAPVIVAAASELLVESWDGGEWREETQDICTELNALLLDLNNHTGNLAAGESVIDATSTDFSNGSGRATLTAPGAGNDGSMELHYDAENWLEYDWLGTGEQDPFGTIRFFGIYAMEQGFIYRREVVP